MHPNSVDLKSSNNLARNALQAIVSILSVLVIIGIMVYSWPRLPWSKAASQRRALIQKIASSCSIGDSWLATERRVASIQGVALVEMSESPFTLCVRPEPEEYLSTDWVIYILVENDRIVALGVRTRDNRAQHPSNAPADKFESTAKATWSATFSEF